MRPGTDRDTIRLSIRGLLGLAGVAMLGAGCSMPSGFLATDGPGRNTVMAERSDARNRIAVVDTADAVVARVAAARVDVSFAAAYPSEDSGASRIGPGDEIQVTVWEAPPAVLFGVAPTAGADAAVAQPDQARAVNVPTQAVAADGAISVPFVGRVTVAGRTVAEVQSLVAAGLKGKAHDPQVVVAVVQHVAATVTVVGAVNQSTRIQLTAKGERVLDAIAAAGGPKQPLEKTTVQLTRGARVVAMPLETVVREQQENVTLVAGDVLSVYYQPLSFTALGAVTRNDEVLFEATGISLAQALGRVSGVIDNRASARGVFVFRFEDPAVAKALGAAAPAAADGRIPIVYTLDLSRPASFLVAQRFGMRDHDVVYVANAPAGELQKFLTLIATAAYSFTSFGLKP